MRARFGHPGLAAAAALLALVVASTAACGHALPAATPTHGAYASAAPASAAPELPQPPDVVSTGSAAVHPVPAAAPMNFTTVQFVTARDGWLGAPGTIGATTDGGTTWTWHALPGTTPDSLSFADTRSGWLAGVTAACSQGGTHPGPCRSVLLHTTDGGATWILQKSIACSQFCGPSRVQALDATHAWALMACSRSTGIGQTCSPLLHTSAAGAHWEPAALPSGFTPTGLDFLTPTAGWVAGAHCSTPTPRAGAAVCPTAILHTTDGGRTWESQRLPDNLTGGGALSFANARDGWLVAYPGAYCAMAGCWAPIYATTDGGATWLKVQSKYGRSGFQGQPLFVTPAVGFIPIAAGAGSGIGGVVRTDDGGRTWQSAGDAKDWSVEAISAAGPDDVWAVGAQKVLPTTGDGGPGFLVHSTDGGATWTQQLPEARPVTAVDFLTPDTGFGLGTSSDPGAVLATRDGGAHWTEVAGEAGTGARLRHIRFANAQDGWASGVTAGADPGQRGQPLLLATRDGGRTWTALAHPKDTIMGFGFTDATHGWMATTPSPGGGTPITVSTTADGASTWTTVGSLGGRHQQLMSIAFAGADDGWALTFTGPRPSGYLLSATADGGRTWTALNRFAFGQGGPIAAYPTGRKSGWVVMGIPSGTALLHTTDAGRTWTRLTLPLRTTVDLDVLTPALGWLLTPTALWRTDDGGATWTQRG